MREQEDCNSEQEDMTLSDRIGRVEKFLNITSGIAHQEEYREAQKEINRRHSAGADRVDETQKCTAFEEIINRIQGSTDRVRMIAGRIEEIGTRVLGPLPENENGVGTMAKGPEGTLDHTFAALNWLDQSLCRLHEAAARLERV